MGHRACALVAANMRAYIYAPQTLSADLLWCLNPAFLFSLLAPIGVISSSLCLFQSFLLSCSSFVFPGLCILQPFLRLALDPVTTRLLP